LDTLHVLAASVWLGGLAMLVGVVLPSGKGNPQLAQPVRRFSVLAFSCVGALVVTGTIQAWRQVGELPALTGTHYGELLLLKVGLLSVVLLFAAASRAVLRRRGALRTDLLGRSVTVESAVGVVVVAVTAVLVATTPAKVAYRPTATRTLQAGPVTLELSAVPQGAHTIDLHLYSFGASRLPIDLAELHGDADRPGDDFGPVSLRLQPAGTGHFVANRVLLPSPGTFTVTFYVRTGQFDSYSSSTHLTVR
jgi:copper transport protein